MVNDAAAPTSRTGQGLAAVRAWILGHRLEAGFALLAVLVRVVFWAVTGRIWEDALITTAHARNAAAGFGLVHHLGEGRVHGFTSALSVLVPLVGEALHRDGGLVALRLATLGAAIATIVLAGRAARNLGVGWIARGFVLGYLALDQDQVFFGMTGMETQIATAVLLGSILAVVEGRGRAAGVGFALAILARPDFVLWVIPGMLSLALRGRRDAARAAVWLAVVVAPWAVFTTAYYGSPVPHTILAKSGAFPVGPGPHADWVNWIVWFVSRFDVHRYDWAYFAPLRGYWVTSPALGPAFHHVLLGSALAFLALAALGVARAFRRPEWRGPIGYLVAFGLYDLLLLPRLAAEWYFPPSMALLAIFAGLGLEAVAARRDRVRAGLAAVLVLLYAAHWPYMLVLQERWQRLIEDGPRREAGRDLGARARPGDTATAEWAGVGFYAGPDVVLLDFPGLTSPRARAALATLSSEERNVETLVHVLEPDWLVLRPEELGRLARKWPATAMRYEIVGRHEGPPRSAGAWGGLALNRWDAWFFLLRRTPRE